MLNDPDADTGEGEVMAGRLLRRSKSAPRAWRNAGIASLSVLRTNKPTIAARGEGGSYISTASRMIDDAVLSFFNRSPIDLIDPSSQLRIFSSQNPE